MRKANVGVVLFVFGLAMSVGAVESVVVYDGVIPSRSGDEFTSSTVPTWVTDPTKWTGTVWIKNYSGITGSNFLPNELGNTSSTLRLTGVSGWLWNGTPAIVNPKIELDDGNAGFALRLIDGYSYGYGGNYSTVFTEVCGSGTLVACDKAPFALVNFRKWNDFTGTLSLTNKIVVFGDTLPSSSKVNTSGGEIWIMAGADVEVPSGKVWHAPNGVKVSGTLSHASLARLSSATTVTLADSGLIDVPGTGSVANFAMDFSKVSGTGAIRYSGSSWGGISTNNLASGTIGVVLSNTAGVIVPNALTPTPAKSNIIPVGYLSGEGGLRCDYNWNGSGANKYRTLQVHQDRDSTWSGTHNDTQNRLTLSVAPGASTAGTLTLSGKQTQRAALTVEAGARVSLTGTWKGPVTVAGEMAGGGVVDGDLTLMDGAVLNGICLKNGGTLRVGDPDMELAAVSTYGGGAWSLPADLELSGEHCLCMTTGSSAFKQDLSDMSTNSVAVSVLAELPATGSGVLFGIYVKSSSGSGNTVFAYADGESRCVSLGYDNTTAYARSQKLDDYFGLHVWTMLYSNGKVARLYRDGVQVLDAGDGFYFSNKKVSESICLGNDKNGGKPLRGLKIYAVHTDFSNDDSIFDEQAKDNSITGVFGAFDFMDGTEELSLPDRLDRFRLYAKCGTTSPARLNGEPVGVAKTVELVNLFGNGALSGDGVTFSIGGIDLDGGTLSMTVDPAVRPEHSLSVFGKGSLSERWRRLNASAGGSEVSVPPESFDECRFFQIRAEEGAKVAGGFAVDESSTVGDGEKTESYSSLTSSTVGGDTVLARISLAGGEDGDYAAEDYGRISFELRGVPEGTVVSLSTNGVDVAFAQVEGETVSFAELPRFSNGITLSLGVPMTNEAGLVSSTNLSEQAGVMSYVWGRGEVTNVVDGVTNVVTMLANRPFGDKMPDSESGGWYRIPAMAKATNGVVVALYDCRLKSSDDLDNAIDWAESVSEDNGDTWSRPHIAVDVENATGTSGTREMNITDPCILYDPSSNRFWAVGMTGKGLKGTAASSDVVVYMRNAETNSVWQEWTGKSGGRSVQQEALDGLTNVDASAIADVSAIKGILQGPGHGFAQRNDGTNSTGAVIVPKGSLVFPMQYFPKGTWTDTRNFALYSTNCGVSWAATALTPDKTPEPPAGREGEWIQNKDCYAQEGCVVELDDGSWEYMGKYGKYSANVANVDTAHGAASDDDAREDCRLFFRSRDFKTWEFDGYHPSKSVRSQGSCLWLGERVKNVQIGEKRAGASLYAACFSTWGNYGSLDLAGKRQRRGGLKVFFGRDTSSETDEPGIKWDCGEIEIRREHTDGCSYNSMVMFDDWTLGVLFESYGHIYLRKVDLRKVFGVEGD